MITKDEDEIINNIELLNVEQKNDFFGFEASKRNVFIIQENNRISAIESKIKYDANRVFINNGDSYHGKYIIQEISEIPLFNEVVENKISNEKFEEEELNNYNKLQEQNVILKKDINEKDELYMKEVHENDTTAIQLQPINNEKILINNKSTIEINIQEIEQKKYNIVTTIKKKSHINNKKYEYNLRNIKKCIISNNKKLLMNEIKKCAVIVYDISLDKNQITEAYIALENIIEEINFIKSRPSSLVAKNKRNRVFILISSILTWGLTKRKNEIPITQADYKHRICHPNFEAHYKLENYLLLLNNKYRGYFYGIVLAPGLVYGCGEHILKFIYKTAFNDTEQSLIPKYDNNLPIIHIQYLAKIVKNLVMYYDKLTKPYIVGIETNRFSLRNIMEAIKNEVHKQNYVYCDYSSLFLNTMVTQTVYDMVTMSIDIIPVINNYITPFMSFDKSIPRIITETATIITEYLENKPKMKNIIINGPREVTKFAKKLAHTYNLDYIDPFTISEEFLNLLENSFDNIDSYIWLEYFINNLINQTTKMLTNINSTSLSKLSSTYIESSNEYNKNKQPNIFDNQKLLEEQRKYFDIKGQISDKYLLPFIKHRILNNRGNKCGYIISNFPETINQALNLFNLDEFVSKNKIYPTIIIDVVMVGKNMMNKVMHNSFDSKLLYNVDSDKLYDNLSLDSKYTKNKYIEDILKNDNIEIRKNRKSVDYLEVSFKPKMFKEYFLITQSNFISINPEEFDKLYDLILTSIPVKTEVTAVEVRNIKDKLNEMYDNQQTIITNTTLDKEEINENNINFFLTQLPKDKTIKEENSLLPEHIKIINFLIKCVNPILVKGILEVIKSMPEDPIDSLVEYIYNQNMYNPCVSSPSNKNSKVANSLNKHLL